MKRATAAVLASVFTAVVLVHADELIAPPSDGQSGLCMPFECEIRIQQVFDDSLFPAALKIESLSLYNHVPHSAEGSVEKATYTFTLSVTPTSSATLSTDFESNFGPHRRVVAELVITDENRFDQFVNNVMTLPLAQPFVYNPRVGNLLLEIRKDRTARLGDGPIYVDGDVEDAEGVSLVSDTFGLKLNYGMTVGFGGRFLGPFTD